ncbi:MAG: hypothetical protein KBB11_04515 [Bacteroidales bacterium]|nr:hypothetical protein [Bacteroidales bacterium]HQP05177.1 clostripain-related cysteine peptidase [Bacteroidales bacterium]
MKHSIKRFVQVLLLFSLLIKLSPVSAQDFRTHTNWLFVYYMPYDNNLSEYGDTIISMIKSGVLNENVAVTIQADFGDTLGMRRYVIMHDTITGYTIPNEYSYHSDSYNDYLQWAINLFTYDNIALCFLDHGGKLNEMCLDEYPESGFLIVDSVRDIIRNSFSGRKIDLLFLQICVKGSIEPIFEFKDVADYTLCSQQKVGAPNGYYRALFEYISNNPSTGSLEIASCIADNEPANMFNSYTLIDNSKLDSLKFYFSNFIGEFNPKKTYTLKSTPAGFYYAMEKYWDLISFIEAIQIKKHSNLYKSRKQLTDFIENEVIIFHKISPLHSNMTAYCGLSFCGVDESNYNDMEFFKLLHPIRSLKQRNKPATF